MPTITNIEHKMKKGHIVNKYYEAPSFLEILTSSNIFEIQLMDLYIIPLDYSNKSNIIIYPNDINTIYGEYYINKYIYIKESRELNFNLNIKLINSSLHIQTYIKKFNYVLTYKEIYYD